MEKPNLSNTHQNSHTSQEALLLSNQVTSQVSEKDSKTLSAPIPELIVWDLDDTLWDCLWHYRKLINATRSHHGLTHWSHEDFNKFGYVHREHMFEHMFGKEKAHEMLNHFYNLFEEHHPEPTDAKLLASTISVLEKLSQQQIPMVAISNTENHLVQKLIKHFQLEKYFKKVVGSQGLTAQWQDMKPNVHLFEQLVHELNLKHIPRKSIWFIGDSLSSDIFCAKNANATGIFYCPPHRSLPQNFEIKLSNSPDKKIEVKPDHTILELEHVINLLLEARAKNLFIELGSNYQQFGFFPDKNISPNTHFNQTPDETAELTIKFNK